MHIQPIITKLMVGTGRSYAATYAFFIGGSAPDSEGMAEQLEAQGYDTTGCWMENKVWFRKLGVTKREFKFLVRISG
jgi:hypothetical protein